MTARPPRRLALPPQTFHKAADLGWKVDEILVYLTSFMTLQSGALVPVKAASWEETPA